MNSFWQHSVYEVIFSGWCMIWLGAASQEGAIEVNTNNPIEFFQRIMNIFAGQPGAQIVLQGGNMG